MKKILLILFALILILPFAACGSSTQSGVSDSAPEASGESTVSFVAEGSIPSPDNLDEAGLEDIESENGNAPEPQTAASSGGILVAYFSHTNNTKAVAEQIHEQVGGDLFRIVPVNPYPENYNECVDQAEKELNEDFRPEIETSVENMDAYDVIYLGYPNWWGTIPMPVATFLETYDFTGKTIIPFCTHEGSRLGESESHIARIAPQATMLAGFESRGSSVNSAGDKVSAWLRELGMIE